MTPFIDKIRKNVGASKPVKEEKLGFAGHTPDFILKTFRTFNADNQKTGSKKV